MLCCGRWLRGHGGGEVASHIAIKAVCTVYEQEGFSDSFFEHAFTKAQADVFQRQQDDHLKDSYKTTLVILIIEGQKAYIAHIGDSRCYYFKNYKYTD